ncbi:uncharacterized protein LOC111317334 [Durio zibethinus]|uniref:Uncharacterized protein LOC111317334 n=1 Tax=Durio zibethinus TaxID=66656 RepID=A0A6P6BEJ7_DURZI|nr:uncharacterized protein LOC111317334 [Durio zibethinus]
METTATTHVLEINLTSAQGLIEPSSVISHRHMKTYAVAWVDSSTKLHTRVDRVGGQNPTWNDKFLFEVSPQFLFSKTSVLSIEVYAVGFFRDRLVGSIRILIGNLLLIASAAAMKTPSFAVYLIRCPSSSGGFFGTLNIGGMVFDASVRFQALSKVSAIDYHGLIGENLDCKNQPRTNKSKAPVKHIMEYISIDSGDQSEAGDSLTSSSSPPHTVLIRELSLKGRNEDHGVATDLVPYEIAEEVISDNEESVVKLEKDVKMIMDKNKKLREMVEMLMVETKGQSTVISDLTARVKSLERKLSRKNKQSKPHYGRSASALKS